MTEVIEHVATIRDGGSQLIKYKSVEYILDYGIGSPTRGQLFKGKSHKNRASISVELEVEIRTAYFQRYAKDLPKVPPLESGEYKFEKPETVEEKPTVSLYNLLDHSATDLSVLLDAINERIEKIEPYKLAMSATYTTLTAWMNIVQAAIKDRNSESEQWASMAAKEINEQTKP